MRMYYDRTVSMYRPINSKYELSREDLVSMLSLVEQQKLPHLTKEEAATLKSFRRSVWGTESKSKAKAKGVEGV